MGRRPAGTYRSRTVVRSAQFRGRRPRGRSPVVKIAYAVATFALVVVSSVSRAQEARLRGVLDAETFAKVTRITDSARAESLPVDPLVGVALEGAQRHASGARIAQAAHDYLVALRGSRAALGADATTPE